MSLKTEFECTYTFGEKMLMSCPGNGLDLVGDESYIIDVVPGVWKFVNIRDSKTGHGLVAAWNEGSDDITEAAKKILTGLCENTRKKIFDEEEDLKLYAEYGFEEYKDAMGTDVALIGFWDPKKFPQDPSQNKYVHGYETKGCTFFDRVCEIGDAVVEEGVVFQACGDGRYPIYIKKKNSRINAFITCIVSM